VEFHGSNGLPARAIQHSGPHPALNSQAVLTVALHWGFKMALTIIGKKRTKGQRGHSLALPVNFDLELPGQLQVGHLQTLLKRSHSTIYAWVKSGRFPQPDSFDGHHPVWKTETFRKFREDQANAIKKPRPRKKGWTAMTKDALDASIALLAPQATKPPTAL